MLTLKNEVLQRTLLRRTKVQQADVLALPPRCVACTAVMAAAAVLPSTMSRSSSCEGVLSAVPLPSWRSSAPSLRQAPPQADCRCPTGPLCCCLPSRTVVLRKIGFDATEQDF